MALVLRARQGVMSLLLASALSACVGLDALSAIGSAGSAASGVGGAAKAGGAVAGAAKPVPVAASPAPAAPPAAATRQPQATPTSPVSLPPRDAPGSKEAIQAGARVADGMLSTGVAASQVMIVGAAAAGAKSRAGSSCRIECEGRKQSITCKSGYKPVCQCKQKPYAACKADDQGAGAGTDAGGTEAVPALR